MFKYLERPITTYQKNSNNVDYTKRQAHWANGNLISVSNNFDESTRLNQISPEKIMEKLMAERNNNSK